MLNDIRFKNEDILNTINHLKTIGGQKFNKNLLDIDKKMYHGKSPGTWKPSKIIKKRSFNIGTGPGIFKYKKSIEDYVIKNKPFVIGLNTQRSIDEKLINVRATCNSFRLIDR